MTPDLVVREIFQVEGKTKKLMGNDDKMFAKLNLPKLRKYY